MPSRTVAPTGRVRLDQALVLRGLAETRSRARDAILRGHVTVDGMPALKPGLPVGGEAVIGIADPADRFVSRAALKLIAGLDAFGYDPAGRIALDVGASTGGFTDALLQRGAAAVVAVDVGHGQLHPRLVADQRVRLLEGVNARSLGRDLVHEAIGAIVCDVSFISLRLVLPPSLVLAEPGAWLTALVKPQFELGHAAIGGGGVVRDPIAARAAADGIAAFVAGRGWQVDGVLPSPIAGGDGNAEFLVGARNPAGHG